MWAAAGQLPSTLSGTARSARRRSTAPSPRRSLQGKDRAAIVQGVLIVYRTAVRHALVQHNARRSWCQQYMAQNAAPPTMPVSRSSAPPRQAKRGGDRLKVKETTALSPSLFERWPYWLLANAAVRTSFPAPPSPTFPSYVSARGCPRQVWRHAPVEKWGSINLSDPHAAGWRRRASLPHSVPGPHS